MDKLQERIFRILIFRILEDLPRSEIEEIKELVIQAPKNKEHLKNGGDREDSKSG